MQLSPYLNFNGNCAEAFRFYEQVLGGKIEAMMTHGESPMTSETPGWEDRILHARLVVGNQVLMGSDIPPEYYQLSGNMYVSMQLGDAAEAGRIFDALAENGNVSMPLDKTFFAERFGMLVDRFGTPWMVSVDQPS